MSHVLSEQDARAWPPVGEVDEPLRTPLWLIRTLAKIARTAEELERSLRT